MTLALFSCTNDNNNVQYRAILQSLNSSIIFIENNNRIIYESLDEKLKDPRTRSKAEVWQPNAKAIQKIFDSIELYIDQLRVELKILAGTNIKDEKEIIDIDDRTSVEQLFFQENKGKELGNKIRDLKNGVINVLRLDELVDYPTFRQNFQHQMEELIKEWPIYNEISVGADSKTKSQNPYADYFKNTNVLGALVMLAKIQNDVLKSEHLMIDLIKNQIAYHENIWYDHVHAIAAQNTTILRTGEEIEITAGIGKFSTSAKPIFTINEQVAIIGEDGVAIYKLKINQEPGKYIIPVRMEFTKADGTDEVLIKNIKYQVVK